MQTSKIVKKPPVVKDIIGSDADPEDHFMMLEQLGEGNYG